MKYLYSMEKYFEPFYRLDPPDLPIHLPALLHTIRMAFTTSRYYNNTSNISALLVKVSNQIIIKCRKYLNCDSTKTIWNQPKKVVLQKIQVRTESCNYYFIVIRTINLICLMSNKLVV